MWLLALLCALNGAAAGQDDREPGSEPSAGRGADRANTRELAMPTLDELKVAGALRSSYRQRRPRSGGTETPKPRLAGFRKGVEPILKRSCCRCHGPETQEGNIRIDSLDPDLLYGNDVNWWLEVLAVLSNGEMPPADEAELADQDRIKVVEWLSSEIQVASAVRRIERGHSSFRRMTRYEYNYALQDLLGLPYDFAKDLPPEPTSEDGFHNSSETLHMSAIQFATYRELSRRALKRAAVRGQRPELLFWGVTMEAAAAQEFAKQDEQEKKFRQKHKDDPEKLHEELERHAARIRSSRRGAHYKNLANGRTARASWAYYNAKYAWAPARTAAEVPTEFDHVAIIPPKQRLIVELGDQAPEEGTLRVRVRASRVSAENNRLPSLQLEFGWQASNDSQATVRISDHDVVIDAAPDEPRFYQWDVPLSEIYPRNSMRKTWKLGDLPNPSEYVRFVNSSVSEGDIQIDYVEITAPVYEQWPPKSRNRIFINSENKSKETIYAREMLTTFMSRAWRREVTALEVDQKVALFAKIRPACHDFQEAIIEVLAAVLASPKFLYLVRSDQPNQAAVDSTVVRLSNHELATRLSIFLWCSTPDAELLDLAATGQLSDRETLVSQVQRMLSDARSRRFAEHFVRQWLGMQLLDLLKVDRKAHAQFDPSLKEAMPEETVAFFAEVLRNNDSVLEFIHADYTMVNERLANHYGLREVHGNHFRRVSLESRHRRGGLLTQAGLLAMNSDGKDSHPLKRGIWLLESLLNDPPPPPPPAVPEIDLADPEIAKFTLKQRIEQHRDHAACKSCHAKIDPWGIAFENFDAVGSWRTSVDGKPVDATSLLFNRQRLDGMDGLKRFLLENRQDQFVRALVHKMTTYALGRPLSFGDRSSVDRITADLRKQGDGLATMVTLIVSSDLFRSK